ncbi:MAG: protein kinase domain-containing protein [Nocardioides sp.]
MVIDQGELFAGRYELGDLLGSGGTGSVRHARDAVLDRPVAIKMLSDAAGADELTRARMRAEAQLAGQLHHPGIAQVYDYGELPGAYGAAPAPYIVLQHVEGRNLREVLQERRVLKVEEVLDVVEQVASALTAAQAAGIVHRDLKPANMILTPAGRVVLVDFGIARTVDADPLTLAGTIVGTADYISPEQSAGGAATARSDLYALGLVAYECLTGHKPFRRESDVATALAHLHDEVPPLPDDVPAGVRSLVGQLIRKDPDQRPRDAAEVAHRARLLREPSARVLPPAPVTSTVVTPLLPRPTLLRRLPGRRSRTWPVVAAVVVAAVAVGGFVAARPAVQRLPDVRGMRLAAAEKVLDARGYDPQPLYVDRVGQPRGAVLGQDPGPGRVADGGEVRLTVASGFVHLRASDLAGQGYAGAADRVLALGLVPRRHEVVVTSGGFGEVLSATPDGRLQRGSVVTLTVAVAPPTPVGTPYHPAPKAHHARHHHPHHHKKHRRH